jgi:hypothetical protein
MGTLDRQICVQAMTHLTALAQFVFGGLPGLTFMVACRVLDPEDSAA